MKTLKINSLILGLTSLLFLNSCTETVTKEEHQTQIANLIESDENKRDSLEKFYIATLDEIDNNLDAIRGKEGVIVLGPVSDAQLSKREQILNHINSINGLMADNKKKLAKLEKSLASYKHGKKELLNSINQAKERMALQEQEINDLKNLLAQNEFKINELNQKVTETNTLAESLVEQNTKLDKDLNRVYFASGTYDELKSKHILTKEGGILGIGRVKTLDGNLDKTKFNELSQKETTTIVLKGKKPKLITKHPVNSYTVNPTDTDVAQLTITDPNSFWSYSKYLVVEVQ